MRLCSEVHVRIHGLDVLICCPVGLNFRENIEVRIPVSIVGLLVLALLLTGCSGTSSAPTQSPDKGGGSGNGNGSGGGSGSGGGGQNQACNVMSPGPGGNLNGFLPFPSDSLWNKDISASPVDPNSAGIINFIGPGIGLHADFGSGQYQGSNIGIPYVVVDGAQSLVNVDFTAYGDESDPGQMPIPGNAPIEGDPNPGSGDRHVLVLDNANCFLYELFSSYPNGDGTWNADSTAIWDLASNEQRPWTWTSADAAGLPIFPGLARYDEIAAGQIQHALRFTLSQSRAAFTPPASHWASNSSDAFAPPMGMKLRLKSSFDISGYSTTNQIILTAMKKYGLIMADNGSSMYLSGAPDSRWDNDDLHVLGQVTASDFEVVEMNPIYTASNVPQGAAPTISSFTATPSTVTSGASVALAWNVSGASYIIVSPQPGPVRGSVNVSPTQTTTYTLYATNQYGRSSASVTVTVQ